MNIMSCPECPDGYFWTREGPTAKACPRCGGTALLRLNGERVTQDEIDAERAKTDLEQEEGQG